MPQIYILYAPDNKECALQIQTDLTTAGYGVWQNQEGLTPAVPGYHRQVSYAILGSAAVILLWSSQAAVSDQVEWQLLVAQRLQKPIFLAALDATALPATLVNITQATPAHPTCQALVTQWQTHLLSLAGQDAFVALLEQLSHEIMRQRRASIGRAGELLAQHIYRQEILALLEYIAAHDFMLTIREAAQAVLDRHSDQGKTVKLEAGESRHMIGLRCPNHHISYYDKREICPASAQFKRNLVRRAGQDVDELSLPCRHPGCNQVVVVTVNCGGYK
jgi:hypothetical protein